MRVSEKMLGLLKERQEYVDLYRDHFSGDSLSGVITDYSDAFVYLSLFSDSGRANGVAVCFRHDVTRIRWGGNERKSLAELVEAAAAEPTAPPLVIDSIDSVLHSVSSRFGYVNLLTERASPDITFIGEIVELDAESVVLHEFGTFSRRDRSYLLIKLDEITRIDADADYEKSVAYLAARRG
jgi:hypothetical protein